MLKSEEYKVNRRTPFTLDLPYGQPTRSTILFQGVMEAQAVCALFPLDLQERFPLTTNAPWTHLL